jgi:tetratricopeptide (TPR) repeat protein
MSEKIDEGTAANSMYRQDSHCGHLAEYARLAASGQATGIKQLLSALALRPEEDWLDCARALFLEGNVQPAVSVLLAAHQAHPHVADIQVALAGMYFQTKRVADAENVLRQLLAFQPANTAGTFLLMHLLKDRGATHSVAKTALAWFQQGKHDLSEIVQAVELLDECDRKQEALSLCEGAIASGMSDPQLHVYAATLLTQSGRFDLARQHYLFALAGDERAVEWNIATGLAALQRYESRQHPDFTFFLSSLQRSDISKRTRASLLFALGKACDDLKEYSEAARHFTEANALCHSAIKWSRKLWRRGVEARIGRTAFAGHASLANEWTPVFIVGMPRSGTTLLAELLSNQPKVCNRGELTLMQQLEDRFASTAGRPDDWRITACDQYERALRSEDSEALWYIDKQPHNFMCVDLILALFPNAKIVYCQRNARDTALSLWSQYFLPQTQLFSYDFADIAAVMQGCKRLMAQWQKRYPSSIHAVQYEQLVSNPEACVTSLNAWLGVTSENAFRRHDTSKRDTIISTASLWQARQPVHAHSIQRWRHYAPYLPELLRLFPNS